MEEEAAVAEGLRAENDKALVGALRAEDDGGVGSRLAHRRRRGGGVGTAEGWSLPVSPVSASRRGTGRLGGLATLRGA